MGTKVNPTVIGVFIVGALMLIVAAVLVFGGRNWFIETDKAVLYLEKSVNGLNVGAPVKFRGVEIGEVKDIQALYNTQDDNVYIQVTIETEPGRFNVVTDGIIAPASGSGGTPEDRKRLIALGLRGQLQVQSMVTGLLFIDFDFYPGTEARLFGLDQTYPELPVIPTTIEALFSTVSQAMDDLGKLELDQLIVRVLTLLERVNAILTNPDTEQALQALASLLQGADQGIANLFPRLNQLIDQLSQTANAVDTAADAAQLTLVGPTTDALVTARGTLQQARKTLKTLEGTAAPSLKQAEKALASVASLTASDSRSVTDLSRTLESLDGAARAIRILAESLQRNPESLLRGRPRN